MTTQTKHAEKKVLKCLELDPGQSLIIFDTSHALELLYNAIADAETYTGINYSEEIFKNSFTVKN